MAFAKAVIDRTNVILIDTPGFDDTMRTDADILDDIATWLEESYSHGVLLTGIVLLQPISGNKVYGSESRRTRLFKKICGENAYGNVIIASTMWSELKDETLGHIRVEERANSNDFWGDMLNNGAELVRHDNSKQSATNIIRKLLTKKKRALQMQKELADNNGHLFATSAAQQLHTDLGTLSEKEMNELRRLRSSNEDNAELRREIAEMRQKLEQYENQKDKLRNKVSSPFLGACPISAG